MTTGATPSQEGGIRQYVLALLGALGSVVAITTALMFYFGWRRSDAQARQMGAEVSLFGFSSQDYVLRSISSLYLPMLVAIGLALAWLWAHGYVIRRIAALKASTDVRVRDRWSQALGRYALCAASAATLCIVFSLAANDPSPVWPVESVARRLSPREWIVPFSLVAATLTGTYAWWIRSQLTRATADERPATWQAAVATALVASVVALAVFWMVEEYASLVGRRDAATIAAHVDRLPRVTVMSPEPLDLRAEGVVEEPIDHPGGATRYRTSGLRLLGRHGGKMLLVHDGWKPGSGVVIMLEDSDVLQWQFSR